MAPLPLCRLTTGRPQKENRLPGYKPDGVVVMAVMIEGLQRDGSRWRHEASFLPGLTACGAGALCEQVRAAGWRGPRKERAFVNTVYTSGSPRLFKNKAKMAGEEKMALLLPLIGWCGWYWVRLGAGEQNPTITITWVFFIRSPISWYFRLIFFFKWLQCGVW